jgi:hypothetical protein
MVSPLNERFNDFSKALNLTSEENFSLNQNIFNIASQQIFDFKNQKLNLQTPYSSPQNSLAFLKIHKQINELMEKLGPIDKVLNNINRITLQFEKIVINSIQNSNSGDAGVIENLSNELNQLKNDPLFKEGKDSLSKPLYQELVSLEKVMKSLAKNYQAYASAQHEIGQCELHAEKASDSLIDQMEKLEQGGKDFLLSNDLSSLKILNKFLTLIEKYKDESAFSLYRSEFLSKLSWQISNIHFNLQDFYAEYRNALKAEVLNTLKEINLNPLNTDYQSLLTVLKENKNKITRAKKDLATHLNSFDTSDIAMKKLYKEIKSICDELDEQLKFLEQQIKILTEKQPIGIMGRWTIYSREKQVEHNIRQLKDIEVDKPAGWGQKVLTAGLWGLYLTSSIGSLVQFMGMANRAWESPGVAPDDLRQAANTMSKAAFIQQANTLPLDRQEEIAADMSNIQGVLNGYIPFTESFAKENPNVRDYLKTIPDNTPPGDQIIVSGENNLFSAPTLPPKEADVYVVKYLGKEVREYYEETGKQLPWKNPLGNFLESPISYALEEEQPKSLFSTIGEICSKTIGEAKTGVPLNENIHLQKLQELVKSTFGIDELPRGWFEWLTEQGWSNERLDHFSDWVSLKIKTDFIQHVRAQNIHVKETEPPILEMLSGSSQKSTLGQSVNALATIQREFQVIEHVSDQIYPGNAIFNEPETSKASRLSSPLSIINNIYQIAVDKILNFWRTGPSTSDKMLMHQLGDFFGTDTGLEGHDPIEALKFYRDLTSSLIAKEGESDTLIKMNAGINRAITLSRALYQDVDTFKNLIKSELEALKFEESIFFTGGWIGSQGGHALIYEIIKKTPDNLAFRFYNTGLGTKYHASEMIGYKEKIIPYIEIPISLEKLLARPSLRAIQIMKTEPFENEPWGEDDVYQALFSYYLDDLKGEKNKIIFGKEDLMTSQRAGTCAVMSLTSFFYHANTDKSISLKIRFKLLSEGIDSYFEQNRNRFSIEPQAQNLFAKTLEEYSRITADMHDKGIIRDQEMTVANRKIQEYSRSLESGRQRFQKNIEESALQTALHEKGIAWENRVSIAAKWIYPNIETIKSKPPLVTINALNEWLPNQKTLIADLSTFINTFKEGTKAGSHIAVLLNIQTLVQKLDFEKTDFNLSETRKVIEQLHDLGFLFYENIQRSCKQSPDMHCQMITPKMIVTVNTILKQAKHLFIKFYPNKQLQEMLIYNYNKLNEFQEKPGEPRVLTNQQVLLMDPKQDKQFLQIILDLDVQNLFPEWKKINPISVNSRVNEPSRAFSTWEKKETNAFIGAKNLYSYNKKLNPFEKDMKDPEFIKEVPKEVSGIENRYLFRFFDYSIYSGQYYSYGVSNLRNSLPDEFYQIYDLSMLSFGIEDLPISLTSWNGDAPLSIQNKALFKYQHYENPIDIQTAAVFHPILPPGREYPSDICENIAEFHIEKISPKLQTPLLSQILADKQRIIWNFHRAWHWEYIPHQNRILLETPIDGLSLEKFRNLKNLVATPTLQIKETLSYFSVHPELLRDPDYQAFFINLIFTPGLLLQDLQKSESLTSNLCAAFAAKNFFFYKNIQDFDTAIFFLHLNRLFKDYTDFADVKNKPQFLDTRSEIKSLLARKEDFNKKTLWLLNKELALSYSTHSQLTHDQAQELLSAAFIFNSQYNLDYFDEARSRLQIEDLIYKHSDTFLKLTSGSHKNEFLNKLAEIIWKKPFDKQWIADPAYPYFKTDDENLSLDLMACKASAASDYGLPKEMNNHPDVLQLFEGKAIGAIEKIGASNFRVLVDGNSYRIMNTIEGIFVQKEFQLQGKPIWAQYYKHTGENFPPSLTKAFRFWVCESTDLVLTNNDNQAVAYFDGVRIYQIDPQTGNETGVILEEEQGSSLSKMISQFEESGYFSIWIDEKTRLPQQIVLPRFGKDGMTFKRKIIEGKARMVCESFPGFFLAEKAFVKDLQSDLYFLLLENASGEQQAILAKQFFKEGNFSRKMEHKSLQTSINYLDKQTDSPHLKAQDFYVYKINPHTKKLEPSQPADRFYLSLRYLWHMRYEEAESLLRNYDNFLRPYSSEEIEILNHIVNLKSLSGDVDPRADALSLYAAYLLLKNQKDFNTQSLGLEINKLYNTYLNQFNNIFGVRLTLEEESYLLNAIPYKNPAMVNRQLDLGLAQGRQAQAILSQSGSGIPFGFSKEITEEQLSTYKSIVNIYISIAYKSSDASLHSPLRAEFKLEHIIQFYDLFSGRITGKEKQDIYKSLLGLNFPGEDHWKAEMASALRLMTTAKNDVTKIIAWMLLGCLEYPDQISILPFINLSKYKVPSSPLLDAEDDERLNAIKNEYTFFFSKLVELYPEILKRELSGIAQKKEEAEICALAINTKDNAYQHSIALKTQALKHPILDKLKGITEKKNHELITNFSLTQLQQLFSNLKTEDAVINREMANIGNSIFSYQRLKGENTILSVQSKQILTDYADKLVHTLQSEEITLRDQELYLLSQINRSANDPVTQNKEEILNIGQSKAALTIDDIVHLYWNRNVELFHQQNLHLSVDKIHQLTSQIETMLLQATYVQQIKRVIKQIALIQENPDSEEIEEQLKMLKTLAEATHAYDVTQHPEYLVLEYYADIFLRPMQIKNLDLLQIRDGKIHNKQTLGTSLAMILAGGKTTVLFPLLAIMNADGDNLSGGILPEPLLRSMSEVLAQRLGNNFKRMVEIVNIERDTPLDTYFLERLQNIRENKKLMLMTDGSLKSLFLNFIEFHYHFANATSDDRKIMEPQRQTFQKILRLFKEHGNFIIDEVDQILNARTEKQYTLGSASILPEEEIELVITLYRILETDPQISSLLRFEFSPDSDISSKEDLLAKKPLLEKTYNSLVKPRLIDAIIEKKFGTENIEVQQFFAELPQEQLSLIKEYLSTQSPRSLIFKGQQSPLIQDLMDLAKAEIQELLPSTCMKISHQNYGPRSDVDYAIPFHGSDTPSLISQFGLSYETLNYSIQLIIKQGIQPKLIRHAIEGMREDALRELNENPFRALEETEAYKSFLKLMGDDRSVPLFGPEKIMETITSKINSSLTNKLFFAKNHVAPQIKIYNQVLSANPQIYHFMVEFIYAFTGTQWNADTFPDGLKIIPDEIITGKTLGLLWKNRQDSIKIINGVSSKTIVQELVANNPQATKAYALIDAAGMIRAIPREQVARDLQSIFASSRPDIKGVAFYDKENNLMILEKGKEQPTPFSLSKLKPDERFTFYDQKRISGADIPQAFIATAIVTFAKNIILRDLLQAVWRMRGLDKAQKVEFTIDMEAKEAIHDALIDMKMEIPDQIKLEHLLLFAAYNQALLQGDNNFRSFKHKVWEILQHEAFKAFLDPNLDGEYIAELFKSIETIFVQKMPSKPSELFGAPSQSIESSEAAKGYVQKIKDSSAFKAFPEKSASINQDLDGLVDKILPLLAKNLTVTGSFLGMEVEIETTKEKEQRLEIETELENEAIRSFQKYRANSQNNFIRDFSEVIAGDIMEIEQEITFETKRAQFNALPFYSAKSNSIATILGKTPGLESYQDIFDTDLRGTNNFFPIRGYQNEPPFNVFNEFQLPVCALMILKGKVFMVPQLDVIRHTGSYYDLNLGLFHVSSTEKNLDFLQSKDFRRKVVQAKFFDGHSFYSKEEIPLLREWIQEKGKERMRELFVKHILKFKAESRASFQNSILDRELK